jgi:hypothetical protein
MAAINDNANVFVGPTLDLFNAMEVVVARDGDVAYAQLVMQDSMKKVLATTQLSHSVKTRGRRFVARRDLRASP